MDASLQSSVGGHRDLPTGGHRRVVGVRHGERSEVRDLVDLGTGVLRAVDALAGAARLGYPSVAALLEQIADSVRNGHGT
jgi:hypothetical protein